jgi:Ala-tRNA(Pro) deacylase
MAIAYGVSELLREHHIPYEVLWHRRADTSLRAATTSGISADRVVKAVVLECGETLFMVLLPANRQLDIAAVEAYVGAPVRLADPGEFENVFEDCKPGAVPVFGPAYGFTTLVDDRLVRADDVYFDGGDQEELIHLSGPLFRRALGPVHIGEFAR